PFRGDCFRRPFCFLESGRFPLGALTTASSPPGGLCGSDCALGNARNTASRNSFNSSRERLGRASPSGFFVPEDFFKPRPLEDVFNFSAAIGVLQNAIGSPLPQSVWDALLGRLRARLTPIRIG